MKLSYLSLSLSLYIYLYLFIYLYTQILENYTVLCKLY